VTFHSCSFATIHIQNDDGNDHTMLNDSDDNDNNKQQARRNQRQFPVDTVQQCIASSEAGCRQHRHVSTQLKRQQALRCSGFGLNNNSCRLAETARASAISSIGGVTTIGNSAVMAQQQRNKIIN